jgi:hypothetical protein
MRPRSTRPGESRLVATRRRRVAVDARRAHRRPRQPAARARGSRAVGRDGDRLVDGPEPLLSIADMSIVGPDRTRRPQVPLSRGDLFINARNQPPLHDEIAAELASADAVDLICAFVKVDRPAAPARTPFANCCAPAGASACSQRQPRHAGHRAHQRDGRQHPALDHPRGPSRHPDVDVVAADDRPSALEVLSRGYHPTRERTVVLDGLDVDIIETQAVTDEDLDGLDGNSKLFIAGHRRALDTARPVNVSTTRAMATVAV